VVCWFDYTHSVFFKQSFAEKYRRVRRGFLRTNKIVRSIQELFQEKCELKNSPSYNYLHDQINSEITTLVLQPPRDDKVEK